MSTRQQAQAQRLAGRGGVLLPGERRLVEQEMRRYRKAQAQAKEVTDRLAATLWAAQEKGASVRVLAKVTGLTPTTVHRLIERAN